MQLSTLLTSYLGHRNVNAQYSYSDVIKSLFYLHSIGADVLDDISTLKVQLSDHPQLQICSADTIEYVCQELRQPNREIITDKGVHHISNEHEGFNKLLSALCKHTGALQSGIAYTMDYDGHIVENNKPDNARNYKKNGWLLPGGMQYQ